MSTENLALGEMLALDLIHPSPSNPRKKFDEAKLQELATSIKSHGVLQAILVRPIKHVINRGPTKGQYDRFELVAGERRFRAAQIAGLPEIPATIRELTDKEVLEIQVIENENREDVGPIEKALAYDRLVKEHGYTPEQIADRVGKSKATILGLLKILNLHELGRQAVEDGWLPMSTAQLIARVPRTEDRDRVTRLVLAGQDFGEPSDEDIAWSKENFQVLSYRETKELIERHFMVELKGTAFNRKALDLVPEAGSCEACPKRTGNNRDLYPDARADVCTDPACFRSKVEAHRQKVAAKAQKQGIALLAERDQASIFTPQGTLHYGSRWVDMDAVFENGKPKPETYGEILGDKFKALASGAIDPKGKLHILAPAKVIEQEMAARGLIARNQSLTRTTPTERAERAPIEELGPSPYQIKKLALKKLCFKLLGEAGSQSFLDLNCASGRSLEALRVIALFLASREMENGSITPIAFLADMGEDPEPEESLRKWAKENSPAELFATILAAVAAEAFDMVVDENKEVKDRLLKIASVTFEDLEKQARKELEKPKKEKAAKKPELEEAERDGLEAALKRALHSFQGADDRWAKLKSKGASDNDLLAFIGKEFGNGGGTGPGMTAYACKGGPNPQFWLGSFTPQGKPTLRSKDLVNKVREVMGIPKNPRDAKPSANGYAKKPAPEPEQDPGEARCVVCGCTENNACPGGCSWIEGDDMEDRCSQCEGKEPSPTSINLRSMDLPRKLLPAIHKLEGEGLVTAQDCLDRMLNLGLSLADTLGTIPGVGKAAAEIAASIEVAARARSSTTKPQEVLS